MTGTQTLTMTTVQVQVTAMVLPPALVRGAWLVDTPSLYPRVTIIISPKYHFQKGLKMRY